MELYTYIHQYVTEAIERLNRITVTFSDGTETVDAPAAIRPEDTGVPIVQTPLMFVPEGAQDYACHPVYFRCGPPPAPERPYVRTLY